MGHSVKHKLSAKGFTLLELMISLSVGLILFAGVMSIFVGMRTTTAETSSYGEMQENGRFAISVLTDDLLKQNFWGDYAGTFARTGINPVPAAPPNECTGGGVNNGTFPGLVGPFRTLWGQTATTANPMGCFNDAKLGSDVLQIKRVIAASLQTVAPPAIGTIPQGTPLAENPVAVTNTDNFFLVTNLSTGTIFPRGVVPVIENSRVWQYQHHVYYIREEAQGSNRVPVLMQGQLTNRMSFAPIIDGIDMIRFMYGIDTDINPDADGYGIVDAFVSADGVLGVGGMSEALWDNASGTRILAIKVYVLARSIRPDNNYNNTSTYQLGDFPFTVNDNYRRLLFTSTVSLYNAGVDTW